MARPGASVCLRGRDLADDFERGVTSANAAATAIAAARAQPNGAAKQEAAEEAKHRRPSLAICDSYLEVLYRFFSVL